MKPALKKAQWLGLLVVMLLLLALIFMAEPTAHTSQSSQSLHRLVNSTGSDTQPGWQQASVDYQLQFPRDHLAHNRFAVEWWYLTANLKAQQTGDHFGVQFTIFRRALNAVQVGSVAPDQNPWLQPQLYMGHLALTDTANAQHYSVQRFSRQGPGLAGSAAQPLSIWLEDWRLQANQPDQLFPAQLRAQAFRGQRPQSFGYQLQLTPLKPLLLQGEQGYSAKSEEGGNASHYYSATRLAVTGQVLRQGGWVDVQGLAWYDHEWTSTTLSKNQTGWDWFALQLEDGRDLTVIRVRGQPDYWQLTMSDQQGRPLPVKGLPRLQVLGHWQSKDGVRYPAHWRLQLTAPELDLEIRPRLANQEMRHTVRYWEGAVTVSGSHRGQGYAELTGYDAAR
ncbi:MAG: hypothetical protein OIF57_18590 [Marinobacterium sp.]|nr:hypothetical protein [Marinobacterium sp.]